MTFKSVYQAKELTVIDRLSTKFLPSYTVQFTTIPHFVCAYKLFICGCIYKFREFHTELSNYCTYVYLFIYKSYTTVQSGYLALA